MRHLNTTKFYSPACITERVPSSVVRNTVLSLMADEFADTTYDGFWLHQSKIHCDVCKRRDPMAQLNITVKKKEVKCVYMLADEMYVHGDYWFYIPEYHGECKTNLEVNLICPL